MIDGRDHGQCLVFACYDMMTGLGVNVPPDLGSGRDFPLDQITGGSLEALSFSAVQVGSAYEGFSEPFPISLPGPRCSGAFSPLPPRQELTPCPWGGRGGVLLPILRGLRRRHRALGEPPAPCAGARSGGRVVLPPFFDRRVFISPTCAGSV